MENNQISNEVLNDLIQINNDRIEGYQKATDELSAGDQDLKELFAEISRQSANFKTELIQEIHVTGEEPVGGTTTMGKYTALGWTLKRRSLALTEKRS